MKCVALQIHQLACVYQGLANVSCIDNWQHVRSIQISSSLAGGVVLPGGAVKLDDHCLIDLTTTTSVGLACWHVLADSRSITRQPLCFTHVLASYSRVGAHSPALRDAAHLAPMNGSNSTQRVRTFLPVASCHWPAPRNTFDSRCAPPLSVQSYVTLTGSDVPVF